MFEKMFDVLMAVMTVLGLVLPWFGHTWAQALCAGPAGAYLGTVIAKFMLKVYD